MTKGIWVLWLVALAAFAFAPEWFAWGLLGVAAVFTGKWLAESAKERAK